MDVERGEGVIGTCLSTHAPRHTKLNAVRICPRDPSNFLPIRDWAVIRSLSSFTASRTKYDSFRKHMMNRNIWLP